MIFIRSVHQISVVLPRRRDDGQSTNYRTHGLRVPAALVITVVLPGNPRNVLEDGTCLVLWIKSSETKQTVCLLQVGFLLSQRNTEQII